MGGKTKQTSETKIDPAVMSRATGNYDSDAAFAETPYKPFEGSLDLSQPTQTAQGLMGYYAPDVSWKDVSTAPNVSRDQINHYMDPYLNQVVDATGADMEQARQVAQNQNKGAVAARSAFGNGRRGLYEAEIDGSSQRNVGSVLGALRSQGFGNAVNWGQQDIGRLLQAALANSTGQLQAGTANQNASLQSAGVRAQGAGLLGNYITAGYGAERDKYLHEYQDPFAKRQLRNQALGSIPVPQSQTQTSKTTPGLGDFLQAGAQIGSAFAMSDARLKTDVEELHHDDAGRRWVSFRYLWDGPETRHTGLMAQEVAKIEPWRVIETPSGYLAVNYAGLI